MDDIYVERDKTRPIDSKLWSPSYLDDRFDDGPKTVFLALGYNDVVQLGIPKILGKGVTYTRDSWLYRQNNSRDMWSQAAETVGNYNSALVVEIYLRLMLGVELDLVHIVAGTDPDNEWHYHLYGYIVKE